MNPFLEQENSVDSRTVVEFVVFGMVPIILLILAISLCAGGCRKKRDANQMNDDVDVDHSDTRNSNSIKTNETDLNGEMNGRPLSHDRALPEIPAVASGVTSTDDDDDDDEGHYDIISKGRKSKDQLVLSTATSSKNKKKTHPYEKVNGDPDSDSQTYAGIKDDAYPCSRFPGKFQPTVSIETMPSEMTSGHLLTAMGSCGRNNVYSIVGGFDCEQKNRLRDKNEGLSVEISNSDSNLVPPVPLKLFDSSSAAAVESINGSIVNQAESSPSPSLPPRNSDVASVVGGANQDMVTRSSAAAAGVSRLSMLPSSMPWTTMDLYPSLVIHGTTGGLSASLAAAAATSATTTSAAKRVPEYSSVTARESLENLRKRQQQQQQISRPNASIFTDVDGTYDTINYDQVKLTGNSGVASENVYNNGSDLYAEIGTGTNSARSSTYARVGELSIVNSRDISECCIPIPPSVNTLQQIAAHSNHDDLTDSGYSCVDLNQVNSNRSIPSTTTTTTTVQQQQSSLSSGRRSPVYAIINKMKRTNRQTIHIDEDVERGIRRTTEPPESPVNLYTKVSKEKNHRRTSSSGASFVPIEVPLNNLPFYGARPKVRDQRLLSGSAYDQRMFFGSAQVAETGYASIDNVIEREAKGDDPDYDMVGDSSSIDGMTDFDPNYETVSLPHIMPNVMVSRSVHGFAREILPNGFINGRMDRTAPALHHPRREHIYEVVKDPRVQPVLNARSKSNDLTVLNTDL